MATFPADLRYTKDHEWARIEGDLVRVGITSHAVEQLGDVTLVELPAPGRTLTAHERFGDIESVKAVSELFAPIACTVVERNEALASSPELVNESPYDKAWMLVVRASSAGDLEQLLDAAAYEAYVASL